MSNQNSSLTIRLGVAGVSSSIADIKKVAGAVKGMFGFLAAEIDPTRIVQAAAEVARFGDELQRLSFQTGASVKSLTGIDEAMRRIGGSAESAAPLISKMQRSIAEAVSPIGSSDPQTYLRMFEALKLDPKALSGLSASDQILKIGEALNNVTNATQRADIAMQIFGRSGAAVLQLFRDPRAMELLREGAGEFGQAMQRNAAALHEAMASVREAEEIPTKFMAGVVDALPTKQITDAIEGAFEAIDYTRAGQNVGAFVTVIINAIKEDKFPEMLGLLIQAGFELGAAGLKKTLVAAFQFDTGAGGGAILASLFEAVMSFGVGAAKFLLNVLEQPVIYMAAGFDWLGSHLKEIFADAINFFIEKWDSAIKHLPGGSKLSMTPVSTTGASSFADSLRDMRAFITPGAASVTDYLSKTLQDSQAALGINQKLSATDNTRGDALERLKALMDQVLQKTRAQQAADKISQGQISELSDVRDTMAQQEVELKDKLLKIEAKLAQVEHDYTKTAADKYGEEKALILDKIDLLQKLIDKNNELIKSPSTDPKERQLILSRNETLGSQLNSAQGQLYKLGPDPSSFTAQFASTITELRNQWGTWATEAATTFKTVFDSAISSISSGITGLIMGTKTWAQALMQIGNTILTSIVQSIVQMGVRWVMTQIMMAVAGKAILASATAATAPIAAAQAAIWSGPATLSTIATYGGSALAAPGFMAIAESISAAQALSGFAAGGYTGPGGKYEPAGIVHRGEIVWSGEDIARHGGVAAVESMRRSGADDADSAPTHNFAFHFHDNQAAAVNRARQEPEWSHFIVDTVTKNAFMIPARA